MSLRTLETAILRGARVVLNNRKLRHKDILEWSTSLVEARDGEITIEVPDPSVYVAVKKECDHRR